MTPARRFPVAARAAAAAILAGAILAGCPGGIRGSASFAAASPAETARDITASCFITVSADPEDRAALTDRSLNTAWKASGDASITIESALGIRAVYIQWEKLPGSWELASFGRTEYGSPLLYGQHGFVNEYAPARSVCRKIRIAIRSGGKPFSISEITVLSAGEPPGSVQRWDPPLEKADLLVLSTHADDEFLYFGGTIPTYAGERKMKVQVSYLINHGILRTRELLAGLWISGVRNYPAISDFPDRYAGDYETAKKVYSEPEVLAYQVLLLRRFKPDVVVGHDLDGEYGHGMHIMNARTLTEALRLSGDPSEYPDSAETYGTWEVRKCYLHLYGQNTVVMDWLRPLAAFGGKTAWEIAKLAYDQDVSQHVFKFRVRIEGPNDCRLFGLYYSAVGPDILKNDFFEHIVSAPSPTISGSSSGALSGPSSASVSVTPDGSRADGSAASSLAPGDGLPDAWPWIAAAGAVLLLASLLSAGSRRRIARKRANGTKR